MKRFYEANASETPPKPPLNPSYGYPQNGNRSLNQKPTKLGAYWFHMITEEFMAVIEGAGLEPDENNLHQLADIFQDFRDRATASEEFKVAAEAAAKRSEEAAKGVVTETASKIKEIQAEGKKQVDAVAQQGTAIQGQVDSAIDSIMAKATEVNAEVQAVGGQEQSALRTACQQQIEEIKRLFPTYVSDLNQSMVKTDAQSLSTKQKQQVMNNLGGTWLPLSGGTMTGQLGFTESNHVFINRPDGYLRLWGGKDDGGFVGGNITLFGGKHETGWGTGAGGIIIEARNGSTFNALKLSTNGSLLWADHSINHYLNTATSSSIATDGSNVTIPFDGLLYVMGQRSASNQGTITVKINGSVMPTLISNNYSFVICPYPVEKGQTVSITTDGITSSSSKLFAFK